ncbi:methyltransferase-like protein 17 [Huso huso]|uniref:Methyltransferase-like protein 17 n=1 Tax=Huso huso TaxID=61971 RepID=A0ABR0Y5C2_HUSHU
MAALQSKVFLICNLCRGRGLITLRVCARRNYIVAHESQVDNSSEFLNSTPHRRHPGITSLKTVQLPQHLEQAAQILIHQAPGSQLAERAQSLCNFLWSRKRATGDRAIQERAVELEKRVREREQQRAEGPLEQSRLEEKVRKQVLSELRKTTYHWKPLRYDEELSLIYLAARLDGGYAAVSRALHEIKKRVPDFAPQTLLDFGSGTGTVAWAAHTMWGQSLREYVCVDSSASMNKLADLLLRGGSETQDPHIGGVYFRQFLPVSPKVQFDLVVSAFSLSELPSASERLSSIQTLWRKTSNFLVLIENGTKEGHSILMEARDIILKGEDKVTHDPRRGSVFAPCPHDAPCPKLSEKIQLPCNFPQAYRPLQLRWNTDRSFEKFSFVILQRGSGDETNQWPRIVQPVLRRVRHVHCHLCSADGTLQHAVVTTSKHTRDLYRCARNSEWGDRLPVRNIKTEGDSELNQPLQTEEQLQNSTE